MQSTLRTIDGRTAKEHAQQIVNRPMNQASFYNRENDGAVSCQLCARRCQIRPGGRGHCRVRENQGGVLHSLVYGRLAAESADPVEKKPLFHFLPGSRTWSITTVGCNFTCRHCQNWQLSQYPHLHHGEIIGSTHSPAEVVAAAERHGCRSLSFTYVEPTIFYEFARDCMALASQRGLAGIFVSNGYLSPECCRELVPLLDAINIDIKSFSEEFYRTICGADLQPVLASARLLRELGVWVEISTLIIPGLNDSAEELRQIAAFIRSVDQDMPWHVSGFHPAWRMLDREPTPAATLRLARQIGLDAGLRFVYTGNLSTSGGEDTCCPGCGGKLISRSGFALRQNRLSDGSCPDCGQRVAGVWRLLS